MQFEVHWAWLNILSVLHASFYLSFFLRLHSDMEKIFFLTRPGFLKDKIWHENTVIRDKMSIVTKAKNSLLKVIFEGISVE